MGDVMVSKGVHLLLSHDEIEALLSEMGVFGVHVEPDEALLESVIEKLIKAISSSIDPSFVNICKPEEGI